MIDRSPSATVLLVRQSRRALFRALTAEHAAIVRVREGEKVVRADKRDVRLPAGAIGVLPARTALTIENRPAPAGRYAAQALVPHPNLIECARRDGLPEGDPFAVTTHDRVLLTFDRAIAALDDPLTPGPLKDHAVREVLLWLGEEGIGFGPDRPPSFVDRLRSILAAEPDTQWRAADAARALAVSEATLRRRLANTGTAFGDLLADVRMTHALGLLQTSELPVNRIALDCGYASPSRFAMRFRARFGVAPSAIRGRSVAMYDRDGAAIDRIGTAAGREDR